MKITQEQLDMIRTTYQKRPNIKIKRLAKLAKVTPNTIYTYLDLFGLREIKHRKVVCEWNTSNSMKEELESVRVDLEKLTKERVDIQKQMDKNIMTFYIASVFVLAATTLIILKVVYGH